MGQKVTLALVGFSRQEVESFDCICQSWKQRPELIALDLVEALLDIQGQSGPGLIIMQSQAFEAVDDLIINRLMLKFKLMNIILVDKQKDYSLALKALRLGVKDIVDWPLEESCYEELLTKLSQSGSQDQIKDLFHVLSDLSQCADEDAFFQKMNDYVLSQFAKSDLIVLSSPADPEGAYLLKKKRRVKWNKRHIDKQYGPQLLNEFFGTLTKDQTLLEEDYFSQTNLDHDLNVFLLGESGKQRFWGLFEAKKSLAESCNEQMIYFTKVARFAFQQILIQKMERKLTSLVHIDDVTGLYNQRKLQLDLDHVIEKYRQNGQEFSVLFMDIDHFKKVNDSYGHRIGSLILMDVAKLLKKILRETDLIYRYGGDEFVIIIPNSGEVPELGRKLGLRILETVKRTEFAPDGKVHLNISVSIGVSEFPKDAKNKEDILVTADVMMYQAKSAGRGQVCYARNFYKSDEVKEKKKA